MAVGTVFLVMIVSPIAYVAAEPFTAISAAAAAISAGTSLAGTTMSGLMNNGYSVTCGIEIENWTRFPLTHPMSSIGGGYLSVPPQAVLPSKREAMVSHKNSGTATGTYGTVSWLIKDNNRRVVVMWSAPYNFNHYSNWMGVGITTAGVTTHNNNWFDLMYYRSSDRDLGFSREEYYYTVNTILYRDAKFEIRGTMGSSHKAEAKIKVIPINEDDLASPIKALLQQLRKRALLKSLAPMNKKRALAINSPPPFNGTSA